jgi:hypothetical protein
MHILEGLLAGAAGTAAMTAHQKLWQRLKPSDEEGDSEEGGAPSDFESDPWESAPAPAQAGKKVLEGLGSPPVSPRAIPLLAQVMHWSYGTMWGAAYGLTRGARRPRHGPLFGVLVWAASYAQLVPLGVYDKPWRYPPGALAEELGYHLTYGTGVALTFSALRSRG